MKCPKCGAEMESGYLQTGNELLTWVNKRLPFGLGFWRNDSEIVLNKFPSGIFANSVPAHICRRCKIFVGDYSEKE